MPPADDRKYPDCPECETDLWVSGYQAYDTDWICHDCGVTFDGPEVAP